MNYSPRDILDKLNPRGKKRESIMVEEGQAVRTSGVVRVGGDW